MGIKMSTYCCGIYELGGFGTNPISQEQIAAELAKVAVGKYVFASVIPTQFHAKEALLKAGFQVTVEFQNPGGSFVTVLGKINRPVVR